MRTWNWKKIGCGVLVVAVLLGIWKGCEGIANRELMDSITLYEPRQEHYEKMYQTLGRVVSQKEVRIPIEGMVVECLVQVGDVVEKDTVLVKYRVGKDTKKLICGMQGIVCEVNEQFIAIVHPDDLWLQVSLPMKYSSSVRLQDEVDVKGNKGWIEKISSVASYKHDENYFDVFVGFDEVLSLFEEVEVKMCVERLDCVYRIPMEAVIRCKNKDYVIKEAWLRDTYELDIDDVVMVDVVGVEDGYVVVNSEEVLDDSLCVFEGLSLEFIEKMLEMYV